MNRRKFINLAALSTGSLTAQKLFGKSPAIIQSDKPRPNITSGIQSGDITKNSAIIWSRSDRAAKLVVEYSTTESFKNSRKIIGAMAQESTDFTARIDLSKLPAGQKIFYRVAFQDARDAKIFSEPMTGSFNTAPNNHRDVKLVWGGDVCGQGWGINPEFGGMKIYEAMRKTQPDFFIHSGDTIYADGVILPEVKLDDGTIWKNIVTPEKSKVAETLNDFRGAQRYNFLDENFRRFNSEVPMIAQWDDHEVRNNWYPSQILADPKYTEKNIDVLAKNARRAFLDYMPMRFNPSDPERIYRAYNYGSLLDVLMLDERSYRGRNSPNNQTVLNADSQFLGSAQINWIKQQLLHSKATWKIVASDMPIGIIVRDGAKDYEAFANTNGTAMGRELEVTELLRFIKQNKIRNVVWLTADVHYCAAHYYDPAQAQFTDFDPFWEFVAGPLNAGTFGPGEMDNTFGPQVKFTGIPKGMKGNRSPQDGFQFFGAINIDGKTKAMTVALHNIDGKKLYSVELLPQR